MTRKNKKKNQSKPIKTKPIPPPPISGGPPPYSAIDYTEQDPSEPPPTTSFDYAIPSSTEPDFKGALKKKLHQSFQMFGKKEDGPVGVPTTALEILYMLTYPVPEENFEDFLVHKKELIELLEEVDDDKIGNLLKKAKDSYFYIESSSAIKISEFALYRSYGDCPQKEFITETHEDLHRVYRAIIDRNVNEELKKVIDYVDSLENKEEIEKSCSTRKSLLEFFAKNPSHYLNRELFKSCIFYCDLIGITVRSHMPLITELEDSFSVDGLPRNLRYPRQSDPQLNTIRQNRDVHMHHVSHSHRIILAKLVEQMPNFLGTGVMEYLEMDENAKKWIELKKEREEDIRTKPRLRLSVDNLLNADFKFRRFNRPTTASQIDFLRDLLGNRGGRGQDEPSDGRRSFLGDSKEAHEAREELVASLGPLGLAPLTVERMIKELKDHNIE